MNKSFLKIASAVLSFILLLSVFTGCSEKKEEFNPETVYFMNATSKTLNVGVTDSLMVLDSSDGNRLYSTSWSSSDPAIVSVDTQGMITALAAGKATVSAIVSFTDDTPSLTLQCTVDVINTTIPLQGISFKETETTTDINQAISLNITFTPVNATNQNVTFISSDETVVMVNQSSGIAVTKAPGTATITATSEDGGFTAEYVINVVVPENKFEGLSLNKSSRTIYIGNTYTLKATMNPADDTAIVTWTTDNPAVATVDNGIVTAIANGTANITASYKDNIDTWTATCKVTVKKESTTETVKATGVTLDKDKITVNKSSTDTIKFTATVKPSNTTETGKWSSSDTKVVTVNEKTGVITVNPEVDLTTGKASATVTYKVGSVEASGIVVVIADDVTIVDPTSIEIISKPGSSFGKNSAPFTCEVKILPEDTSDKTLIWTSADETIVTVADGVITPVSVGETTVSVRCKANETVNATFVVKVIEEVVSVTKIELNLTAISLNSGKSLSLAVDKIEPENASDKTIIWTSSDETVATVDNNGKVTAIKAGKAIITAASNSDKDIKATCEVTVDGGVQQGTVEKTENISMKIADVKTLKISTEATSAVTWKIVSGADFISAEQVTEGCKVTASAEGTAVLTAEYDNRKDIFNITITTGTSLEDEFSFDVDSVSFTVGDTAAKTITFSTTKKKNIGTVTFEITNTALPFSYVVFENNTSRLSSQEFSDNKITFNLKLDDNAVAGFSATLKATYIFIDEKVEISIPISVNAQ